MFNATATPWIPTEYEDFYSVVGTIEVYEQILGKSQAHNSLKSLVSEAGVEPARPEGHGILSRTGRDFADTAKCCSRLSYSDIAGIPDGVEFGMSLDK